MPDCGAPSRRRGEAGSDERPDCGGEGAEGSVNAMKNRRQVQFELTGGICPDQPEAVPLEGGLAIWVYWPGIPSGHGGMKFEVTRKAVRELERRFDVRPIPPGEPAYVCEHMGRVIE